MLSGTTYKFSVAVQAMYTRHLRTLIVGLVLGTLLTILIYTAPAPTTLVISSVNSLRYDVSTPAGYVAGGTDEGGGGGGLLGIGGGGGGGRRISEDGGRRSEEQCLPHHHVMFLKTHKCASSTVQNIFLRYGYNHNLTFALPGAGNYLGNPGHFKASMMPRKLLPPSGRIDIFAVHTRLNVPEHSKILHNDTRWITIVRDPSTLYESLFNFFNMKKTYGLELSEYSSRSMSWLMSLPRHGGKFGKNQILFDLGYPDNISVSQLRRAIDDLDKQFDLVMVSKFMDESLVLMRHLLCWSLDDVVVFTKNARRQEVKPTLEPKTLQALRELNSADVLLYDHFVAKHRRAVLEFGLKRMADEVAALRGLREEYYDDCVENEVKGRDSSLQFKEYSGLVSAYVAANNSDQNCLMLSMPELPFVDAVRRNHVRLFHG